MRLLLCTDLDRTLLPNGAAPESANESARTASPPTNAFVSPAARSVTAIVDPLSLTPAV